MQQVKKAGHEFASMYTMCGTNQTVDVPTNQTVDSNMNLARNIVRLGVPD